MNKGKRIGRVALCLIVSLVMIMTLIPRLPAGMAFAAVGGPPPHAKNLTDNHDGTYTVSLDVTGESIKKPNNVNVIVILDRSGSMANPNNTNQRMNAAKNAVNNMANSLFAHNTQAEPDVVEMALVTFSNIAEYAQQPTTSYNTFSTAVNRANPDGGTNWEAAMQTANDVDFNDDDRTFVIFVSDGNPTFRFTEGNYPNHTNDYNQTYYNRYGVWGSGSDTGQGSATTITRCYDHAVDDAQVLAQKVGAENFYTIGAFGSVDRMQNLTTAAGAPSGNYYSASDTAALNQAINDILAKIEMAGFADVDIEDGTTNQVKASSGEITYELLEVDTSSFKYYRSGGSYGANTPWTSDPTPPEAKFVDGQVEWDLSSLGVLENGVKYTVTFDCYPSQYTYDTIAQLKNGDILYSELDPEVQKYIIDNGNGNYSLLTNTNATLDFDDTRTDEDEDAVGYINPPPVATSADSLPISKEWEGADPDVTSVPISVLMDGDKTEPFHTATLTAANGWKSDAFISVGIIKNGQVLPGAKGHDFSFAELDDTQYHWEIDAPVVRPMLINGGGDDHTPTMLIKVDADHPVPGGATTYEIDGATYYVDDAAVGLTATNYRRSNLNLSKTVTGEDAPKDATFPFTLTVNNALAPDEEPTDDPEHGSDYWVWFSIYDTKAGATVTDATITGATGPNTDGYYYAPSGSPITVEMKDGWNLRFTNLPTKTTYTFVEGDLADGFAFKSAELTVGDDSTFSAGQTSTGTIEKTQTAYQVAYTNDYQLTDLEITKKWEDNNDQDGIRLTPDELAAKLTLSPAVEGKTPTITDNGNNTYTIKYTGLPRFNNGQEVEYTVAESAIDGYTTEGSPAKDHGTITNTHVPEVTTVTVVKVWEDSNDIGKIRPTSIQAQLKADGTASGDPVTLNAGNEWIYTWENLPKYKDGGTEIVYTADETAVPTGYEKSGPEKATADDGTITFTVTNTYNPTPVSVDPPVQKVIENNSELYNGGDFTFNIEAVTEGAPMPANDEITNSAEYELEGKTGFYEFGVITFTQPGTYTYKVTESGEVDGVTNDPDAATGKELTFTVTDDGTGKLVVSPTTDQAQWTFTNTYDADGEATITVSKEVSGAAWPEGKTLTIAIEGATGAPMPEETSKTLESAGSVSFGPIKYGLSDAGKSFTYTITEGSFGDGWTGTPTSITANVAVVDNGNGTLGTTVTYSPDPAKFTNTYTASGKATIEAIKAIEGAGWPEDATITFTLAGTQSAPMPAQGGETVTLTEAGKATFGEITYTEADIDKTYTYTISEDGFGDGWTGSGNITATVKITDNGDGTLATEVTYDPTSDTITNTYEAEGEAVLTAKKAIAGADWPEGKSITFTLAGEGGTLPETKTATLTEPGTATFGAIKYDESDIGQTYTYTITEDGFGTGWTGSPEKITATVKVTDNGNGTLSTEVTYDPTSDTITNTYEAEGTAVLEAIKAIEGAGWPENGSITFTLAGEGGTLPETKTVTLTEPGTATFGAITYDESDIGETYTYTITEDGFGDGWTADPGKVINATVKVTDNGDGSLATEITYDPTNDTITNKYDAEGEAVLTAKKAISGAGWPEGKSITFTLAGEGGTLPETKTATLNAPGTATFGAITYDESDIGQTYTYTITEDGFGDGWTGSPESITATVVVTDNGDGTLATAITYSPEDDTITNTYEASGSATLKAKKLLTGRDWMESESFTFTLKDPNGTVVEEKTVTEDGEVEFAAISYDESDAGKSYTYTITETGNSSANVTPSGPVEATVTITDNGDGSLATSVAYSPEDATIINTYVPTPVNAQINVNKTIDGFLEGQPDNTFEFTLYDEDGEQVGEKISITTKSGKGSASFAPIEYPAVGEYNYTVKETIGSAAGYTYSTIEYPVVVTVTDDPENGKLVADVSYGDYTITSGDETLLDVINEFEMEEVEVTLTLTKKIDDQSDSAPEGTFNFTLYKDEVADDNLIEETSITTNGLTGSAEFKPLTFDKSGEYTYVVVEEAGDVNGFTYDTTVHNYLIVVDDNFDAAILEVDEDESTLDVTITNVYKATATSTILKVKKEIEDTSGSAYETEFTFTLTGVEGSPMPEEEGGDTVTVVGAQEGEFGEIKYEKAGTFEYTIKEVAGDAAGYQYDTTAYKATVTVVDDGGDLVATAAYIDKEGESQTALTITNTYDPKDADIVITANKRVEDKTGGAAGNPKTFTFELLDADGNVIETVTRQGGGTVTFSKLTYSKVGVYNYTIREVPGSDAGYTYDTNEYGVIVEVTDPDKDGILKAAITAGDSVEFVNPYEAKPCGTEIELTKKLTGRDLEDGEFEFVLVDITGGGSEEIETVTNNEKGNIVFSYIEYFKAGTHTYEVYEVVPDETNGVVYDQSIEVVTVKVTDDGNGQLSLTVTYGGDKTFENSYEPEGSFEPEVTKILEGKDLKDGQFTFTMVGPDGQTYTAKNDAEGKVVFEALDFDINDVGQTYEYTITEVNDGQENIKYDDHAEKLTITVKDNGDGTLEISGDYSGKATFTNKYEEPPAPPTGDTTVVMPYIVIGISSLILLLMLLFRARKNRA